MSLTQHHRWVKNSVRSLLLATFALVAGCGPGPSGGKIVLRIADWGGAGDDSVSAQIERDVYAGFEKLYPNIEIQREGIPGSQDYVKKILLGFISHSEPDVIRLDASSAAVFVDNDILLDLAPLTNGKQGINLSDFFPNTLEVAQRGKSIYAIPVDFTPMVMYYNRRLFDEAHVPYPTESWTWPEFLDRAQKLTKGDRFGYTFTNWMAGWILWIWNNSGDVLDQHGKASSTATSQSTVDAVTFIRDLVNKYKVAPSLSQQAAEGALPFANGDAAMEMSGHWNLTTLTSAPKIHLDDVGVAPIPVSQPGQKPVTVLYESGWAIGKHSQHTDAAWKFIRYFTSAAVQRQLQKTGIGVCARKDIANERAVNDREREFLKIVPSGKNPWGAKVQGYDFVEDEGTKMMDSVLKSGKDPRAALKDFASNVDRELGKQ